MAARLARHGETLNGARRGRPKQLAIVIVRNNPRRGLTLHVDEDIGDEYKIESVGGTGAMGVQRVKSPRVRE